jgi:hypothetical protein
MQAETLRLEAIDAVSRERALQRLVTAFICTGLAFLLLPGTFLGVRNLLAISSSRSTHSLSPAWIQAHGQAQLFGWIGTFVIGIGFYSLSKMGRLRPFAIRRGWQSGALWVSGISLRWVAGIYGWHWRVLLPVSAALELAGFVVFFLTVRQHKPQTSDAASKPKSREIWMLLVIASTLAFFASLMLNLGAALCTSIIGSDPALPAAADRHLVLISSWAFLVVSVWGFNARWLPVFLGLRQPDTRGVLAALATLVTGVISGLAGAWTLCALLLLAACILAVRSLHVFEPSVQMPKVHEIHSGFPCFVRGAYAWLLAAAGLFVCASLFDRNGGIGGASRHALTVGFLATMVFAIGPRILPAFCGMRVLFSKRLMLTALLLLNIGCLLRVTCEIPAYERNLPLAWKILPFSAVIELTAVAVFAANLITTFLRPPAHLSDPPQSPLVSLTGAVK